ncbi:ankyrin repeat domain-containing protein 62-like [Bubalus kerabau]|uniref:ankyrin repeat domain-containing protein 62-like n=1 Tax=Bubalus carabanensis TaxID=3119969 RepID=UPI00244EF38C|nr:ankyrin repeat domain-containing protein 62-like [Bubalus carabanensis]
MKKIFGFGSKKGESPSGSSINPVRDSSHGINFQPGYRIRDKDLRKIHKAAIVGNVAKVQHVVLFGENGLNDKDKMNRTALHLACANGHSAVVTLLLERKCLLNVCDNENRTALMKAVECQEEECATLLLEHGADPNVMDVRGNTALHYAVFCQNISLAAKLLSYNANIEARNKDDLTPLLLAICERSGVMVEFLVTKKANIHAVDKMKRTALMLAVKYELPDVVRLLLQQGADIVSQDVFGWTAEEYAVISGFDIFHQLISEYKEKRSKTSPENSNPVDESSEEHSSRRFPNKPGVDLGHTSNDEVLGFKTKHVLKPKLMKLMKASQQSKRNKAKCGILRPESIAFSQDNNSGSNVEDVVETFPKPSPWFEGICHPAFPLPEPVPKLLKSVAGLGRIKVEEKKHKSSEVEVSENVCDAADESGLFLQRKHGGNSNQEFPAMQNEGSDSLRTSLSISHEAGLVVMNSIRPARKTPYEKKKVKEQINYENDLDDLTQSSKTVSEDGDGLYSTSSRLEIEPLDVGRKDSVSLLKIQDTILPHERLVGFQRSHCELLRGEFYKMKSKVRGLQKELSETREMKSQLEHQKVEWERELSSLRFTLKQEDENRRNADMLCEKMREHLRRKEDECSKEVEVKQQLELTLQAVKVKLKTEKNNLNQVSDSCEKAKDLLCKNHMLQEEIAMLRLERDALKNQHGENEENYFKDIEILKVQNDDLQKTINLDEETLTKTVSHYTGQLNALTAENAMLNSKLENEKESKQRLETEVESYSSRLAAALHDRDQGQTSKRDLELAFRRARDEWLRLQDKMKSDVANLKDNNEMLSQQLSTVESKFNKLKIKLHHTRDDLREKTLMLEHVQRDLNQAECQKQDIEHVYRNQQGKVNTYLGKQESLERLSQLQSENMLLRQQLDDARNRADSREKTVISIQDQFQQIMRKLQAEREKQGVMLEERNKELVKERNHLKERMCQYENEKAEGEAVVRQLQQELDDAVKKQSMLEASLRVMSRYCPKLEAEAQDLKNNCKLHPRQVTSQTQAGFQQMEVRIKDLESELSKMKSLQEDSNKAELEKYKQLYLVECELIKSLEDKLDKTHQRLAVVSTKLEVEKQQNRSLFKTVSTRPVLEPPCVGNFNNPLVLNGNLTPRANVGFSTSIPHPSNNSMETYLTKMRRELDRSIARALREVDAQFASDAFRVSSRGSTDGSNVCDDLLL